LVPPREQQAQGRNIFLVLIPPGNREAWVHYEDTIQKKVEPERIYQYVSRELQQRLRNIFVGRKITVWGSEDRRNNREKFERMRAGDEILIVEGPTIKLLGKVAATTVNAELSAELWKPLGEDSTTRWDLIYFIANPQEINLPFVEFCRLMGYSEDYHLRGFASVSKDNLNTFYSHYDDLYSILMLIKQGQPVHEINLERTREIEPDIAIQPEDIVNNLPENIISDHLRMQWTLLNLGRKAGSKVWIPAGDQGRIREQYQYNEFEPDFTAGLDAQTRYIENIDVVWKEEFRIDAAFEIENSTAIYSGLLRFSDLTLVAPNTIYPLFIVAPPDKRNRLIEQLRRPTFQKMHLDRKVRYLSYEAVEKIDRDYQNRERGLTLEYIIDSSEEIQLHH